MPPTHPVTDVGRVLNAATLTESPVTDSKAATGGNAAAKGPSTHTLMLYDDSDAGITELAPILARAYYPKAKLVGVQSLAQLAAALSKYSRIDTLVINTHSAPGYMMLGYEGPSVPKVRDALKKTGVTVTSKIVFEGCQIMQDPIGTCRMVEPICGPNTQVTGFTYFSISIPYDIDCTGIDNPADIQAFYDQLAVDYLLPGLPSAAESVDTVVKHARRWFRDSPDETVPEKAQGARIKGLQDLQQYQIKSAQDALQAQADFSGPVVPGARVTVTNVAAVTSANQEEEALADP